MNKNYLLFISTLIFLATIAGALAEDNRTGIFPINDDICQFIIQNETGNGTNQTNENKTNQTGGIIGIKSNIFGSGSGNSDGWCSPEWKCSEWSECRPDGKQMRTCEDRWNCKSLDDLPALWRTCKYSAENANLIDEPEENSKTKYFEEPSNTGSNDPVKTNSLTGAVVGGGSGNWIWPIIIVVLIASLYVFFLIGSKRKKDS